MKNHQRISQPTALPDGGDVWHVVLSSKMYRRVAVERSQCTSISPHKCMLDWSNSDQVEEPLDPSMSKYFIWWGSQSQRKLFWLCTWIQKWNKNKIKSQNHLLFWKLKGKMESPNQSSLSQLSCKIWSPSQEDYDLGGDLCRDLCPWCCLDGLSFSSFVLVPLVVSMGSHLLSFLHHCSLVWICLVQPFQFKQWGL